jgi:hypothetical protein
MLFYSGNLLLFYARVAGSQVNDYIFGPKSVSPLVIDNYLVEARLQVSSISENVTIRIVKFSIDLVLGHLFGLPRLKFRWQIY